MRIRHALNGDTPMRTLLSLSLFALLSITQAQAASLRVFACEPEWAALTEEIAGDLADITTAIHPSQDPHKIEARPTLISAVRRADLVFCTGAELEVGWLPVLLSRGANPKVTRPPGLLYAADQVTLIEVPERLDRADGDIHAAGNPHLHLDPRRLLKIAEVLTERLVTLDADNGDHYRAALLAFQQRMGNAISDWEAQASSLRGNEVIVHHRSFSYLLDWLGIDTLAELEPKPGLPPTAGHLASLVSVTEQSDARLILYTDYNGDRGANWLAQRTNACAVRLPLSPTGSVFELFDGLITTLLHTNQSCGNE